MTDQTKTINFCRFRPAEVVAAAPSAFAMASGRDLDYMHPLAAEITLKDIALAAAMTSTKNRSSIETEIAAMGRGMGTTDFAWTLSNSLKVLVQANFRDNAEHLEFCEIIALPNFRPSEIYTLDADIDLTPLLEFERMPRHRMETGGAVVAQLSTFAKFLQISRESVINDQMGAIATAAAQYGTAAARVESRLVAAALEENPELPDGNPVFIADENDIGATLNAESFGDAIRMLRMQKTSSGKPSGNRAKHMIVAPDLEFSARGLLKDYAFDKQVTLSVLTHLPTGRWFLTADKKTCTTVALLRLQGSGESLRVEPKNSRVQDDGAAIAVALDTGVSIVRRLGIVRGGM